MYALTVERGKAAVVAYLMLQLEEVSIVVSFIMHIYYTLIFKYIVTNRIKERISIDKA